MADRSAVNAGGSAAHPRGERPRLLRAVRRARNSTASLRPVEADAAMESATPPEPPATSGREPERKPPKPKRGRSDRVTALREHARLLIATAFLVIGIVLVILGWYGAAHTNIVTEQIPYLISGGVLGMALIILAGVIGASASLERENREMRRQLIAAIAAAPAERGGSPLAALPRLASDDGRVHVVPGGRSFHLPGCPILEGKDGSQMSRDEALAAGFADCKLCGPD